MTKRGPKYHKRESILSGKLDSSDDECLRTVSLGEVKWRIDLSESQKPDMELV